MKIKDQYIKVLKNFLYFNSNFGYDGNRLLQTKSQGTSTNAIVETYIPDFIDLPIYTKDLNEILRFWTSDTDVSEDVDGNITYLILKNENGEVRYRLSNSQIVKQFTEVKRSIDEFTFKDSFFKFNLDYRKYSSLVKSSKIIGCDTIEIYSIDENRIGIRSFVRNDKNSKQYSIEIEKEHTHREERVRLSLELFELVMASDYNFEVGILNSKNEKTVIKVIAFNGNLEVKYLFLASV